MPERSQFKENDPSLVHLPPQNIEAEESLISSILVDNHTPFGCISKSCQPTIFTKPPIKKSLLL